MKYNSIFAVFILISVVFNGMVSKAAATVTGDIPPENGDWIVSEDTLVKE